MKFKIRASQIGKIMTNSRKKGELSQTAKTYCEIWLKEKLFNRKVEFKSKYTDKGNIMEDESIDFISENLGYGFLSKNEEYFSCEFIHGTPDLVLKDEIIDIKNSWDFATFPLFDTEIKNKDYFYQLQGYMHLTGKSKAKLIYTLMDTPIHLIEREAYYWCKNNGYEELDMDVYKTFMHRMTYNDIEPDKRIKVFNIDYDSSIIESVKDRVAECQEYINTLIND